MANISANSTTPFCADVNRPLAKHILIPVELLLAVTSFFGNILVIAVVYRKKELRTTINYFIVSMAISDLLVPLFSLPLHLNNIIRGEQTWIGGPFGEFTCKFVPFAVEVSTVVSILTMIIIAAERYYSVHFPLKVVAISSKSRYRLIATTWVISAAVQSHLFFVQRLNKDNVCIQSWEPTFDDKEAKRLQIMMLFVFQYVIPFAVLVIIYTAIIVNLNRKKIVLNISSRFAKRREARNRKITLMVAIVAVVFLVAWSPVWILMIRVTFVDGYYDCSLGLAIGPAASSYAVVNPLMYYVFNERYRKAMNEILLCDECQASLLQYSKDSAGSYKSNHLLQTTV